jgi:Sec-independent protein secretion pathway component TatC
VPLVILYEFALLGIWFNEKRRGKTMVPVE